MGELSHEDYYSRLCDRSRRRRDDRVWAPGSLHSDQGKGRRTPPEGFQTIAVGFGLIGVAQALRLLLLIWDWLPAIAGGSEEVVG